MSTKVGDIFVRANLDDKQYKKGLTGLSNVTSRTASKITKALTFTAVVAGLTQVINKASQLGDTIDKTSQKLGMSNKTYQEWSYIMARNGASIDSMTVAMKTLASSVETGKDALEELGISQQEAMSMSQEELFARVIEGLQKVEDKTHRTYLASQLLGRGATELGAVLNLSSEDMEYLRNRLVELGGVMSDTAVKNSARFRDSLYDIKIAFQGISNTIAEYVLPVLTNAINNVIIPAIQTVSNALRALFGWLSSAHGIIGKGAKAVKDIFNKSAQKDISKTGNAIGNVGSGLKGAGSNAKKAKKEVQALKRELLGFDKITKLTKQDSSTGTSGGSGVSGGGIDYSQAESDTQSFANNVSNILSNITIPDALQKPLNHLKEAFGGLFDTLSRFGAWTYENVLKPMGEYFVNDALPVGIETLADAIDFLNSALKLLGAILEPVFNLLKPFIKLWADWQVEKLQYIGTGFSALTKVLDDATNGVARLKTAWENVKNWFTEKKANISIGDNFTAKWKSIKSVWDSIKNKTATISISFKNALSKTWNDLAKKINNAKKKAPKTIKNILPTMPYLAQGGFVKANTPQLAVIGDNKREGEIVAPESKLRAMANEVSQNGNAEVIRLLSELIAVTKSKNTDVYLDGEQIKNNVVRRINNHTRATGQFELVV